MRTEAKFLITTEPSKENCPRNEINSWIERGEFLCTEWAFLQMLPMGNGFTSDSARSSVHVN